MVIWLSESNWDFRHCQTKCPCPTLSLLLVFADIMSLTSRNFRISIEQHLKGQMGNSETSFSYLVFSRILEQFRNTFHLKYRFPPIVKLLVSNHRLTLVLQTSESCCNCNCCNFTICHFLHFFCKKKRQII